jgi:hypothetical protein
LSELPALVRQLLRVHLETPLEAASTIWQRLPIDYAEMKPIILGVHGIRPTVQPATETLQKTNAMINQQR